MTVKLALQVPAVAWCVNMIASAAAVLPVKLYHKKEAGVVEEITDDPRVRFLNGDTGDTMNADNMRRKWVYDYLLRGSAFGYLDFKDGFPDKVIYIPENVVSVLRNDNDYIRKRFSYLVNGEEILPYRMLKILRNSDGFGKGTGIVEESPLILETMYQLLKFQKNQVLRGGNKRGFLQSKGTMSKESQESVRKNWSNIYSDEMNVHKVMMLNGDIDFKEMSSSSVEMQINENVRTNDTEVMRLFGTQDGILSEDTVKNAVMPVLDAFEAAFDSDLLLEREKADHYFAFDTKELTRGNMGQRMTAYGMALQNNIMQLDEVRAAEDLPPLGFNYIKLGLQDVLLNPKTGEVYTPNMNASANMNELGNVGGENKNVPPEEENRGELIVGEDGYLQEPDTGKMAGRISSGGGLGKGSENGVDKSGKSGIIANKDKIIADFKSTNFNGEIHIPPKSIDVNSLTFDNNHINGERNHAVSEAQAKQFIKDAKISFRKNVNGIEYENYVGYNGCTYVNVTSKLIRTSFGSSEYNAYISRIVSTIKKYDK